MQKPRHANRAVAKQRAKRRRIRVGVTVVVAAIVVLGLLLVVGSPMRFFDSADSSQADGVGSEVPTSDETTETTQAGEQKTGEQNPDDTDEQEDEASNEPSESSGDTAAIAGDGPSDFGQGDEAPSDAGEAKTRAELAEELGIVYDYRDEFVHGDKGAEYQRYIVIHDTEVDATPQSIVDAWDGQNLGVATHFVIGKDGGVVQCVPLDKIAHHAGFGDAGNNARFGVEDDSRDDKVGTTPIGSSYPDYGMNSYSIGIELVHVGSTGEGYPEEQLVALDGLIAYIDASYGGEGAGGTIIDHKTWRASNSDTSPEFAGYLASYQERRTHA